MVSRVLDASSRLFGRIARRSGVQRLKVYSLFFKSRLNVSVLNNSRVKRVDYVNFLHSRTISSPFFTHSELSNPRYFYVDLYLLQTFVSSSGGHKTRTRKLFQSFGAR